MVLEAFFGDGGKKLYIVGRAVTVVVGLAAGAFSLAIGGHNYLRNVADRGPAIILKTISIGTAFPGETAQILLSFDKKRHCQPDRATAEILGMDGVIYPAEIKWPTPYPVMDNIKGRLEFSVPRTLPFGETNGGVIQIYHNDCADGMSPEVPATIAMPKFEVKKRIDP